MKLLLLSLSLLFSNQLAAKDIGLQLAKQMKKANAGYISEAANMEMILIDAHGTQISRKMLGSFLEVKGDGDKGLIEFITPKDIKGTKMLTWSHRAEDDDQWLYMPAIRRVKRINSRNKSSSFMGSEFSYEDLSSQEVEKFTYKYLGKKQDKKLGKIMILEKTPINKSGYTKQIHYIVAKYKQANKIEYFDKKQTLLKKAIPSNFKKYTVGKKSFWRPGKITMVNIQTRKKSIMSWSKRKFAKSISAKTFTKSALK